MARLILFRHAKAVRKSAGGDKERALERRGREAAARMGAWIRDEGLSPDLALVSDARRARETLACALEHLGRATQTKLEPRIYEASADTLLRLARAADPHVGTLLLVGHNPSIADFATLLTGDDDAGAMALMHLKFPTGAVAILAVDGAWRDLRWGGAHLLRFVTPGSLVAGEDED